MTIMIPEVLDNNLEEKSSITGFLVSLGKYPLSNPRITSIIDNPSDPQHPKLMEILSPTSEFYKNFFSTSAVLNIIYPSLRLKDFFSKEFIEQYFSPEFLLDLEGEHLEKEIAIMKNISEYIATNVVDHLNNDNAIANPIATAYFVYALYRAGLDQNSIMNFFYAPTNGPQIMFPLPDNFQAQFNRFFYTLHQVFDQGSQTLFDLCLELHNKGASNNLRVALVSLMDYQFFDFLKKHFDLFKEVLIRESADTIRVFIPCLSSLFYVIPKNLPQEKTEELLSDILNIVRSGKPQKLVAAMGAPEQFAQLLKSVNFDLKALEVRFEQVSGDKLDLMLIALKNLSVESVHQLFNNRYFSFQKILDLPKPMFLNAVKFLNTCLSGLSYTIPKNFPQEKTDKLLGDIIKIIKSGRSEKLLALSEEPIKFAYLLRSVNFDLQALEAGLDQMPDDKSDLLRSNLRNLSPESLNHLLNFFSLQEISDLPRSVFPNVMRLLNTLYSNPDVEDSLLPAFIRESLIYDHNNQTPDYQANFNRNLERIKATIIGIEDICRFNLRNFDDCLQMLGLAFNDAINIHSTQTQKFAFLISFVKHLTSLGSQTEKVNFIRDYLFLFNKFIGRTSGEEYSFAAIINNSTIRATGISNYKTAFQCLSYIKSPFEGVAMLENINEELKNPLDEKVIKKSRLLQLKILAELSDLSPLIQFTITNCRDEDLNTLIFQTRNSVAKNVQSICETCFPQFTKIRKQIEFETEMLSTIKELKSYLNSKVSEESGADTFLDRIIDMYASSTSLEEFLSRFKASAFYEKFQEICSPVNRTLTLLNTINATLQPFVKSHSVFELIAPRLLFTGKCESALNRLKNALASDSDGLLREFILRLEQPKVQGSAADFIRTIVINPECLDEIRDKIYESIAGKGMSRKEELTPINDGAKDLCMALGLSEKEILFTRLEGIYNRFVSPDSIQDALGGIARSEKFWTEGYGVGGKSGYSQDDIKKGAFYHSLRMWAQHMLSRAELYNPYEAKANSESNSTAYGFLFLLSQQNIMSELNDLRQLENQMPYNEFLEASVRFVKRFEPVGSKPAGEPAMFWEHQMQGLSIDAQVAKLIELGREEVVEKADTNTQVMSNELDLDRADLSGKGRTKQSK